MPKGPTAAVVAAAKKSPHDNRDKLVEIQKLGGRVFEITQEVTDLEERIKELNSEARGITDDKMPSLMLEAKVDSITINTGPNSPKVEFDLGDVYRASISSEWPEEKQKAAFEVLRKYKAESLISTKVSGALPKGKLAVANKIAKFSRSLGVDLEVKLGVHHGTLSAWVKETYKNGKSIPAKDLEKIGGFVGKVARPKVVRE